LNQKKGDVIKFRFIRGNNYGYYFYDGEKVIPSEFEGDESGRLTIPSIFKVPSDFSINYWDETGFLGFSNLGDLTYDTKNINLELITKLDFSENDDDIARFDIYKDINYNHYIVIYYEVSNDNDKRLNEFIKTGRCDTQKYLNTERKESIEYYMNGIAKYINSEKTVYVNTIKLDNEDE